MMSKHTDLQLAPSMIEQNLEIPAADGVTEALLPDRLIDNTQNGVYHTLYGYDKNWP